jgi:hypothetical protein
VNCLNAFAKANSPAAAATYPYYLENDLSHEEILSLARNRDPRALICSMPVRV